MFDSIEISRNYLMLLGSLSGFSVWFMVLAHLRAHRIDQTYKFVDWFWISLTPCSIISLGMYFIALEDLVSNGLYIGLLLIMSFLPIVIGIRCLGKKNLRPLPLKSLAYQLTGALSFVCFLCILPGMITL